MSHDITYNPRTGEFDGLVVVEPQNSQRTAARRTTRGQHWDVGKILSKMFTWFCVGVVIWLRACDAGEKHQRTESTVRQQVVSSAKATSRQSVQTSRQQTIAPAKPQQKQVSQSTQRLPVEPVKPQPKSMSSQPTQPKPRPVCGRCGGKGQVCADCLGTGSYVLKCEQCQGTGKKGSIEQVGEAVGSVIALPLAIVGKVFGAGEEIKIGADGVCPDCGGNGTIKYACSHVNGKRRCPACSR